MSEALDIDLYQIRMLVAFYKTGMQDVSGTMDAFVRKMPSNRKFLVVCGIDRILSYIADLNISDDDIEIFKQILPDVEFDSKLCDYLKQLDFLRNLEVYAIPEGRLAFANEPVVSITGPIGIVQFIEKKVLSILNHDIRIASKAARIYLAAGKCPVSEFGGRRGGDAMSAEAARAAFIGGFSSTSNVLAYHKYGIPCIGTMGHLWPMSHLDKTGDNGEIRAFKNWCSIFKKSSYLVDTYDTIEGTAKVIENVPRGSIDSIRLDSGDLCKYSFLVKRMLMNSDNTKTKIGATNDLNEYKIKELLDAGCPIDWFGCGTEVVSTPDSPSCGFIYKLVDVDDPKIGKAAVAKFAADGKATLPGRKQIVRHYDDSNNIYTHDTIDVFRQNGLLEETVAGTDQIKSTVDAKNRFISDIEKMPEHIKLINDDSNNYKVELSDKMREVISAFKLTKIFNNC